MLLCEHCFVEAEIRINPVHLVLDLIRTFGRTSRREETIDANANFSDSDAPLGKTNQHDSLNICGGSPGLLIL